jgi:tetratricopeptide (TPR) repeat protein
MLALIHQLQGELPRAIEQATLAQQSLDERVPAQLRGEVLKQVARLQRVQGQLDAAIASYRQAREAWQAVPAPNQVELALLDGDIADCLVLKGERDAAQPLYDDAIQRLSLDTSPDDHRRAYPLLGRGRLLLARGEREAGIASLRAALALEPSLTQDPAVLAELRWELGRALRSATEPTDPGATAEAVALVERARETFAAAKQAERVAEIDAWLAETKLPATDTDHPTKAKSQ